MAFQNQCFDCDVSDTRVCGRAFIVCVQLLSSLMFLVLAAVPCSAQTGNPQISEPFVKTIATRLRGFGVPFNINADDSEFIELHLYVTKDKGNSWQFYDSKSTDSEEFPFKADEDGEYWFALKTLNRDKKLLPEGAIGPELKVIVDTVKPKLQSSVDSDAAGRIVCRWEAKDKNIDPGSLKILYRCDETAATQTETAGWSQVPITLTADVTDGIYRDQVAWWPKSNSRLYEVRLEIADTAGNAVHQDSRVTVPLVAWRNKTNSTAHAGNWASQSTQQRQRNFNAQLPPNQNQFEIPRRQSTKQQFISGKQKMVCEGGVCKPVSDVDSYIAHRKPGASMVGSQIEHIDPPVPDGSVAATGSTKVTQQTVVAQTKYPAFQSKSIPWSGITENPTGEQNLAVGSTLDQVPALPSPNVPNKNAKVARNDFDIRSLPPQRPHNSGTNSTIRDLPGGMFVAESTASRKRSSQQPAAEFRANTEPDWKGRGETGVDKTSAAGFPAAANTHSNWQNEPFRSSSLSVSSGQNAATAESTHQHKSVARNGMSRVGQSVSFGLPDRAPEPRPLNAPTLESMQHINSRRFNLNYGIDAIDPSGVSRVVLWMTRDGGLTWKSWSSDPDRVSPFPVQIEEPGVYGFRIVVHSNDGLTGLAPRRGDKADMWVNVDTDAPSAQITSVPYGRGNEAGRLVINWEVQDPLLTLRPITLAYGTDPQGPWTAIENGLRNTGRYVWKVGTNVPERIYLRLEATDQAGNVGVFQLENLIDISGLVPRGHIKSVEPIGF